MIKILCVGDLHGRKEACANAISKFKSEGFDKIVFIGDYTDSFERTNEDILDVLGQVTALKTDLPDNVVLLIGNHDWSYFEGKGICSGFRPELNVTVHPFLRSCRELFQICHMEGNYLFSHAGIQRKWFNKHVEAFNLACNKYGLQISVDNIFEALNSLIWTKEEWRINEVGEKRGGIRYDLGGPLWCDKVEMQSYGPIKGLHQVVGHTPIPFIERVEKFEGDKRYNNTSVTFIDCLGTQEKFLELEIL